MSKTTTEEHKMNIQTKNDGPFITVHINGEYVGIISRAASNRWIADTGIDRQQHATRKAAVAWVAWKTQA